MFVLLGHIKGKLVGLLDALNVIQFVNNVLHRKQHAQVATQDPIFKIQTV